MTWVFALIVKNILSKAGYDEAPQKHLQPPRGGRGAPGASAKNARWTKRFDLNF